LDKLGLKEPPKSRIRRENIPRAILDEMYAEERRERYRQKMNQRKKVIFLGKKAVASKCTDPLNNCMDVVFDRFYMKMQILEANLVLWKKPIVPGREDSVTVTVDGHPNKVIIHSKSKSSRAHWLHTHLMGTELQMLVDLGVFRFTPNDEKQPITLRLECANCRFSTQLRHMAFFSITQLKNQPVMPAVHSDEEEDDEDYEDVLKKRKRRRRNLDGQREQEVSEYCEPGNCCRMHMMMNFTALKWDWVITPKTYDAYVCVGECTQGSVSREHSGFVRDIKNHRVDMCCVPKSYKKLKFLYTTQEGHVVQRELDGFIVKACECRPSAVHTSFF